MLCKEKKIGVRFDDITPTMNWSNFNKIKNLLDEFQIKPLLGVVPDNKDEGLKIDPENPEFWRWVKECENAGYSIAMHGYQHFYTTKRAGIFPINSFSEFAGESAVLQKKKIVLGKRIFNKNGINVDTFVAPGHSFDINTIHVLQKCGFQYISDGYGKHIYTRRDSTIKFIPIMLEDKYREADYEVTTAVFHLNASDRNIVRSCEMFLKQNRKSIVPYSELFKLESREQTIGERMTEVFAANKARGKLQQRRFERRLKKK